MSGIKYYQLGNNEEPPDEFCVVRDVNGEPEEYTWYEPMDSFDHELWSIFNGSDWVAASEYRKLNAENAKLRKLVQQMYPSAKAYLQLGVTLGCNDTLSYDWALQMTELEIEVDA